MSKVITFDFDNTIAMSYMDIDSDNLDYIFQGYNEEIIKILTSHIQRGDEVHIVTSRQVSKEGMYPEDTIEKNLEKLGLKDYFWPDRVHFTNGKLKKSVLQKLGSSLHYDDDVEELIDNFGGIPVKNPLDFYKDSDIVCKAVIFDNFKGLTLQIFA